MELTRQVKYMILFVAGVTILALYFLLTNQYRPLFKLINTELVDHRSIELEHENQTDTYENRSNVEFQSRVSAWYPHLSIHMFTQNLSLLSNTTKLILIGNPFFGDRNWGMAIPGRTSQEISNKFFE